MKQYTLLSFVCVIISLSLHAQSDGQQIDDNKVKEIIYHKDSLFWEAYNQCDVDRMATFLTDDMEFYHDKISPIYTLAKFKENIRTGLCGKADWRLRREPFSGTVKVFLMNNYGGLISGEHIFYINDGTKETLDGYG